MRQLLPVQVLQNSARVVMASLDEQKIKQQIDMIISSRGDMLAMLIPLECSWNDFDAQLRNCIDNRRRNSAVIVNETRHLMEDSFHDNIGKVTLFGFTRQAQRIWLQIKPNKEIECLSVLFGDKFSQQSIDALSETPKKVLILEGFSDGLQAWVVTNRKAVPKIIRLSNNRENKQLLKAMKFYPKEILKDIFLATTKNEAWMHDIVVNSLKESNIRCTTVREGDERPVWEEVLRKNESYFGDLILAKELKVLDELYSAQHESHKTSFGEDAFEDMKRGAVRKLIIHEESEAEFYQIGPGEEEFILLLAGQEVPEVVLNHRPLVQWVLDRGAGLPFEVVFVTSNTCDGLKLINMSGGIAALLK